MRIDIVIPAYNEERLIDSYEAHHYFDGDYSGTYKRTFAEEALAAARGSARVKVRTGLSL